MTDSTAKFVPMLRHECFFCRKVFYSQRSTAEYCCDAHKQKAYRWRLKITKLTQRTVKNIELLGEYLDFDKTTAVTIQAFATIRSTISDQLLDHNIKAVK